MTPVYDGYFADPFVWRHDGMYYAVGTGAAGAWRRRGGTRVIPVLTSGDLRRWEPQGYALVKPEAALGDDFWAPEVAVADGTFYMYYSVGHEDRGHHLRVATSRHPGGPYEDAGVRLTSVDCAFAIDPHPFRDEDGRWYLFYARDFLDVTDRHRAGTALVVDRLVSMTRTAGEPRTVLRACFDWQRFQRDRVIYGDVYDWHTLEGPCVRRHDGRYYCFYSGGRWQSETYGVDYGVAHHADGPYEHPQVCVEPRVLRTIPGRLIGPGHNCIVSGPDGVTDFIVFHAWGAAMDARRMHVAPLRWTADGPRADIATGER